MRNSSVDKANEKEKMAESFAITNLAERSNGVCTLNKSMEGFLYLTIKKAFFTNVTHKVPAHIDPSLPKIEFKDFDRLQVCVDYMGKAYKTKTFS